jgi:uncharacterized protein (UPF0332 family)
MATTSQDFIIYRINKSTEIFQDALLLAQNERWNSCINRLYYSTFYLVSALLYQKKIKTETHNGIKSQFFLHFIKTGLINKEYGKLYSHLFDWRQESDYADFRDFDKETVIPILNQVKEFNKDLKKIILLTG